MPQTMLSKLIRKTAGSFLDGLLASADEEISILDANGALLMGSSTSHKPPGEERVPILSNQRVAGWVAAAAGSKWAAQVAGLVSYLLAQETEKKALAGEVLDKYRELHLLYRLSERLIVSPKPEVIGQMALNEVCTASQSSRGLVALTRPGEETPEIIATCGCSYTIKPEVFASGKLIGKVILSGNAEISITYPPANTLRILKKKRSL